MLSVPVIQKNDYSTSGILIFQVGFVIIKLEWYYNLLILLNQSFIVGKLLLIYLFNYP